ncbi:MAG: DUF91 domain-containing protein [Saprospiraceae bacterium]|nr:DUF91 domain-containing protein [Pyrinomonadaceae bacterium]
MSSNTHLLKQIKSAIDQRYTMPKVLKLSNGGIWVYFDGNGTLPENQITPTLQTRHTKESRIELFLETLKLEIEKFGQKTLKVSTLMERFSIGKRSSKNLITIKEKLASEGLYTQPEYSNELRIGSTLRIPTYPVRQPGELFAKEKDLEDFVAKNELYTKLNISSVERQHRPKGTKDKLDFKGNCENEQIAVLELKNRGGGKSAVEQVLRYAGLLKREFPNCNVRMILVTGIQNRETELAINGMQPEQRKSFEWYLYKYHKDIDSLEFERVEISVADSLHKCELRCPVHCLK